MELNSYQRSRKKRIYLLSGGIIFLSTLAYYLLFRAQLPWPGYLIDFEYAPLAHLGDLSLGSFPSFAFTLSMGLVSLALFNFNKACTIAALSGVWAIGVLHEVTLGTFSQLDVAAGTIGIIIPLVMLSNTGRQVSTKPGSTSKFSVSERLKLGTLMLVSATLATGTSAYDPVDTSNCTEYDENNICVTRSSLKSPVYLSYADLRSAVKMSGPREMTSVSRIYLYESMLFVNERNEGIHIIDNRFPNSPKRVGFIEIPGNTEISIKDNNLYADSYIDLITLDVQNIESITEIDRQESIFPYNARQNIPNNVELSSRIDRELGVVVGYQ